VSDKNVLKKEKEVSEQPKGVGKPQLHNQCEPISGRRKPKSSEKREKSKKKGMHMCCLDTNITHRSKET
jgi:hypothetical protein